MSVVTDVVLLFSLDETSSDEDHENSDELPEEVEAEALNNVNIWLHRHGYGRLVSLAEATFQAGDKAMQSSLHAGAFNRLDEPAFVEIVLGQPWRSPADVQLLIKGEFDTRYTMHSVPMQEIS